MDEVMETVDMATQNGNGNLFIIFAITLVAVVFLIENIRKFREAFGIQNKWERHEQEQNAKIQDLNDEMKAIKNDINELCAYSKNAKTQRLQFEEHTTQMLKEIRDDMIKEKIERLRSSIIEFSACVRLRDYNQESYNHIFDLYSVYQRIIEENHLKNGYLEVSMEYIKKRYAEQLAQGFKDME